MADELETHPHPQRLVRWLRVYGYGWQFLMPCAILWGGLTAHIALNFPKRAAAPPLLLAAHIPLAFGLVVGLCLLVSGQFGCWLVSTGPTRVMFRKSVRQWLTGAALTVAAAILKTRLLKTFGSLWLAWSFSSLVTAFVTCAWQSGQPELAERLSRMKKLYDRNLFLTFIGLMALVFLAQANVPRQVFFGVVILFAAFVGIGILTVALTFGRTVLRLATAVEQDVQND